LAAAEVEVNEHDVRHIEETLQIALPADYGATMAHGLSLPPDLFGYVLDDPSAILGINNEFRTGEFKFEWDDAWFIVGNDACGNLFILDLRVPNPPVLSWDHETHEMRYEAKSFGAFLERLREEPERF
jgi:hypothetical protein